MDFDKWLGSLNLSVQDRVAVEMSKYWMRKAYEAALKQPTISEADFDKLLQPYKDHNGNVKPKDAYRALLAQWGK